MSERKTEANVALLQRHLAAMPPQKRAAWVLALRTGIEREFLPPGPRGKLSGSLGAPPAVWRANDARRALWTELRFSVGKDVAIEMYRVGFAMLVEAVDLYRLLRDRGDTPAFLAEARKAALSSLKDFRVPPRRRRGVLEGGTTL